MKRPFRALCASLLVSQAAAFFTVPLQPLSTRSSRTRTGVLWASLEPEEVTRVRINSPRGGESLPTNYARSFPHFVAGDGGKLERIPKPETDEGFVEPTSFAEVWLPEDLPAPEAHLCLTFVLKDGRPRYILPAVDLLVKEQTAEGKQRLWRNRGLNSVAMAKSWLEFDTEVLDTAAISVFTSDPSHVVVEGEPAWSCVVDRAPIRPAVEKMVTVLSEAPAALASGFLYLTVNTDVALPVPVAVGGRLRAYLSPRESAEMISSPAGPESAFLDISWVQVAAGGKSEFLPAAYRPLYNAA